MELFPPQCSDADRDRLVSFEHATVVRLGGEVALRGLSWTIRQGETWAVVGPTGSGKTTLAEALQGQHRLAAGTVCWPLLDRLRAAGHPVGWPSEIVRRVAFKEEWWPFSYRRHYYQQRFNFIEPHDDLTLDAFLRGGTSADDRAISAAARRLGIESLRPLSLIKLSSGQIRRARIVKALLARPEMLILDDPFLGLDAAGRDDVAALLGGLVRDGMRVLLITRPDLLPAWVTHVLELDRLAVRWQGRREDFRLRMAAEGPRIPPSNPRSTSGSSQAGEPVIELRDVNVIYGGRAILKDVSWTVRAGERWAVLGPNGSGKTTLLSLLSGDHPQAYCNAIRLFGRPRGTGESIWDIKQRIGLVSPELHLYFSEPLTAAQTVATGFFDVLTYRRTTPGQDAAVRELFDHFGIADLADRPFARLSTGEQRLVLLLRALVKRPPVLILDEPFQGLDDRLIGRARDWLDHCLRPDQTLLFVSHHPEEIPYTVNRRLCLDGGRVAAID
ncbi:MAG TPA: ATP-binding cassette domain-containing protein [Gemmataceae bacterium]|nr:ATP-binding cassette domain-containing protein [Gemmataceae bacterium]